MSKESKRKKNEEKEESQDDKNDNMKEPAKKTKLIERYKEANKSKLKAFNKSKGKK